MNNIIWAEVESDLAKDIKEIKLEMEMEMPSFLCWYGSQEDGLPRHFHGEA